MKNTRTILFILAAIAIIGGSIYATKTKLQKGQIFIPPGRISTVPAESILLACAREGQHCIKATGTFQPEAFTFHEIGASGTLSAPMLDIELNGYDVGPTVDGYSRNRRGAGTYHWTQFELRFDGRDADFAIGKHIVVQNSQNIRALTPVLSTNIVPTNKRIVYTPPTTSNDFTLIDCNEYGGLACVVPVDGGVSGGVTISLAVPNTDLMNIPRRSEKRLRMYLQSMTGTFIPSKIGAPAEPVVAFIDEPLPVGAMMTFAHP